MKIFIGIVFCGIGGAIATHYGSYPALLGVVVAEIGMGVLLLRS